ncbi:MAG: PLP-dependent aminotransferase family protein, partial [Usitatibacter sp.]
GKLMKRYQALANELSRRIQDGVLRPGERLPSVRNTCRMRRMSPATVHRAYRILEDDGKIRVKPRSGYYVSVPVRPPVAQPRVSRPAARPTSVRVRDLMLELTTANESGNVSFGSFYPAAELFPRDMLARAMHASQRKHDPNSVYGHLGHAELRRSIARRYLGAGCDLGTEEIIVTTGAMEALNLCLQVVTQVGDLVAIECPAFPLALDVLERLGRKVIQLPTDPVSGISLAALSEALRRHPVKACWLMPILQNPLGAIMPEEAKRELVKLLAQHDIPLIEDDAYGELHYGCERPKPAKAFDRGGRVLHCGTFSKCLAPGYRVGWVAPGRYQRALEQAKFASTISTSVPPQAAIVEYLKRGGFEHHLRRLRRAFEENRERMAHAISMHFPPGTRMSTPQGGYFMWVEMPAVVDTLRLHPLALEHGISIAPGPMFSPLRRFESCMRLNYGLLWSPRQDAELATLGQMACSFA